MQSLLQYNLYTHIFFGFIALIVGVIPMIAKKGGKMHKTTGWIYVFAMTMIFVTALPAAIYKQNYFLLAIAVFSFYLTVSGVRLASLKKLSQINLMDKVVLIFFLLCSVMMLITAFYFLWLNSDAGIILLVFGIFFFLGTIQDIRRYLFSKNELQLNDWFFNHLNRICGAYIATFTAFAVTNITFLPTLATWLIPTVIGAIGITLTVRHYRKKMGIL